MEKVNEKTGRNFSQIPHLFQHERVKTGEKLFECIGCGKGHKFLT